MALERQDVTKRDIKKLQVKQKPAGGEALEKADIHNLLLRMHSPNTQFIKSLQTSLSSLDTSN